MNNTTTGQANIPDFNLGKSDRGVRQQGLARKAVQFTTTPSGLIQPLPIWAWLLTGILVVCALKTKYPSLTVWAILLLPVIASLLRIKGVSGVLLACCLMQWLQIVTPVIYCDFRGVTFEEAFEFPEMAKATQLSLWGIMCLTVGIRVALGRWSTASVVMEQEASAISISRLARLWWIIFFVTSITDGLSWRAGSLQQVLVAIGSIKWVIFFVLCYKALNCRDGGKTLIIAMFIDFSKGLLGFFGTFKEVLLMFMIVIMSSAKTMSFRLRFLSFIVILLGLAASVFWSAVKMEYRSYLQDVWDTRGADISISQKILSLIHI